LELQPILLKVFVWFSFKKIQIAYSKKIVPDFQKRKKKIEKIFLQKKELL